MDRFDEVYSFCTVHDDSTITLSFMSETGTYNRDNIPCIDFTVTPETSDRATELINYIRESVLAE